MLTKTKTIIAETYACAAFQHFIALFRVFVSFTKAGVNTRRKFVSSNKKQQITTKKNNNEKANRNNRV